jgi:16S rRNA (guanine966-N2)-methyltransferase
MRIVSGKYRGRVINAPAGEGTRPTTDRVREALMSSLSSQCDGLEGAVVLDAFAGSGALGLEALSRGASRAVFYERDRKAQSAIDRNISSLGLTREEARLCRQDILKAAPMSLGGPFDVVFLDPPYAYSPEEVLGFVSALKGAGRLKAGAVVVYEHALASGEAVEQAVAVVGFEPVVSKKYGKTGVTMMRCVQ